MKGVQENNLEVVRACMDAINRGDVHAAARAFAETSRNHDRVVPRAAIARVFQDIITRFPDAHLSIDRIVAVGDAVIAIQTYSGTHRGMGQLPVDGGLLVGVPPTGKRFSVQHIHWYTLTNALIIDHRASRDDLGMMLQLGLITAPPATAPP